MKKRLLGIIFILVPVLAAMFSFVACSKAEKYSVTFDIDISKYSVGYWTSESKTFTAADTQNMIIQLSGFDVYDYSEVKVLLNGEENSECFTNNYQKPEVITGASVNIGSIELNDIKKDTVVTVTGAKDRTVKIAFVDATDDRLGNDKVDLSEMDALEQSAYRNMMLQFGTTFKTKVSDADYQYLQSLGIDEQYIEKDEYGYIYALNLLTDDHGNVLYEKDNPDYTAAGDEPETLPVYSPYFFSYRAADMFKASVNTWYTYIKKSSGLDNFEGTFHEKPSADDIPQGAEEYVYESYSYDGNGTSYYGVGLFPMISEKGNGYYDFDSSYTGSFAVNNSYRPAMGQSESIVDSALGKVMKHTVFTDADISETASATARLYDYFKFGIPSLCEQNLIVIDFAYMAESSPMAHINDLSALVTDENSGGSSIESLGSPGTDRTFRLSGLGDVYGVSGIDFSKAEVYVQGVELKGDKGSYRYVPAQGQEQEYFEITLKAGVLPIDFYTVDQLKDDNVFKTEDKYEITVRNIDFSAAEGVTNVVASCESSAGEYIISPMFSFDYIYGRSEDGLGYYYFGDSERQGETGTVHSDIGVGFSYYAAASKDPRLIIKKDGVEVLNIDVLAKANAKDFVFTQDTENEIRWSQDGFTIYVSCWNIDSGMFEKEFLSSIEVSFQSDGTTDLWEIAC